MTPERMAKAREARRPASGVGQLLALLSCDTTRRVLEVLVFHADGLSTVGVARRLGITSPLVAQHLRRLREAGLVTSAPPLTNGRRSWHTATEAGHRAADGVAHVAHAIHTGGVSSRPRGWVAA